MNTENRVLSNITPHPALVEVAHRPFPLPDGNWRWRQNWEDLLFAHWRISVDSIRHLVPKRLTIQEFDGSSWIGLVPFSMRSIMMRPLPDLPYFSEFLELNVRLYVECDGIPGVWFLSLDAANIAAVCAARVLFSLPYFHAKMNVRLEESYLHYTSRRKTFGRSAECECCYKPVGDILQAKPGTLEYFLTERYCLYACNRRGDLFRGVIHHRPWPLQRAEASFKTNTMVDGFGLSLSGEPEVLHFSKCVEVAVWSPTKLQ